MVDRVALITGGARGIGRVVGIRLAKDGWGVAFCYRTSAPAVEETPHLIEQNGGRSLPVRCDVSDSATEQRWGRIVNFSMASAEKGVAQPQITATTQWRTSCCARRDGPWPCFSRWPAPGCPC